MFTGIVDHCGVITQVVAQDLKKRILVQTNFKDLKEGESISVDGTCLTVISPQDSLFYADLSPETLKLTIASQYTLNTKVNLERSLRVNDRLGGHFVTGHVDYKCCVIEMTSYNEFLAVRIQVSTTDALSFIVKKGSVAINGVSLTINEAYEDGFEVMLIPHTLSTTNLSSLTVGSSVNIEFDYLAKLVAQQLKHTVS